MSGPDWAQLASDAIDNLGDSPTPAEARAMTDRFEDTDILAALVSKGGGGGGGGSTAGAAIVRGPFAFAFDTPDINNGVAFYTPTIGDILLDAWIEIDAAFNGTTPKADLSQYTGSASPLGLWGASAFGLPVELAQADTVNAGGGPLTGTGSGGHGASLLGGSGNASCRIAPARFTTADPLLLVVSQDGSKGGMAVGGSAGAGKVYIVTATPTAS